MPSIETERWEFVREMSDFLRWLADEKELVLVPLDDSEYADLETEVPAAHMPDVLAMEYANTFDWSEPAAKD